MSYLLHFIKIHSVIKYAGMFPPVANNQEVLSLVMRFHIKAEIIGHWLYCYTTPLIGVQLECLGFWYSFKHNAYVLSGTPKAGLAGFGTLGEIRASLGSQQIKGGQYV